MPKNELGQLTVGDLVLERVEPDATRVRICDLRIGFDVGQVVSVNAASVGKESQDGVGQQVELDNPLTPNPDVVNVRLDAGPGLGLVLDGALLGSPVVLEVFRNSQKPVLNELGANGETGKVSDLGLPLFEVRARTEVLFPASALRQVPRQLVQVLDEVGLFVGGHEVEEELDAGQRRALGGVAAAVADVQPGKEELALGAKSFHFLFVGVQSLLSRV